jgi:hypothetical protein
MTEEKVIKAEEKAKFGRPSEYKEEYCDQVIDLMKEGASKAEVCLELNCSFQTFLNWQSQKPDFLEAVKRGLHLSKGKWEQMGRKAAFGNVENFNATAWIFNMKNRFGKMDDFSEKWSDKQEHEHSGEVTTFNMNYGAKPADADD